MTKHSVILDELDQRASEFRFPVLDNANARFIAGRMRGFRLAEDWSLVFEVRVFSPGEIAIVVDVYAFGTLVGPTRWKLFQTGGLDEVADAPLWDDDGLWIRSRAQHRVILAGQEIVVSCRQGSVGDISLPDEDCADEIRFTRSLIKRVGLEKLVPRHVLIDNLPALGVASELFSIVNWDHPDLSRGEKPSESEALRAAAKLLSGETSALIYDHYLDNLESPRWNQD